MLKAIYSLLSPNGQKARLSILILHRVLPRVDPIFPEEIDCERFEKLCFWMKSWFNVLPLDEAVARLKSGCLPARAAAITFDDGYADNHEIALPILMHYGLPATFFIATGFIDGGRMWSDTVIESIRLTTHRELNLESLGLGHQLTATVSEKRAAIESLIGQIKYQPLAERVRLVDTIAEIAGVTPPQDLMMSSKQLKQLREAGMQIGAHTVSHPILAVLETRQAREEICCSKEFLEDLLCEPVKLFAYPNGKPVADYSLRDAQLTKEIGFDVAVSTAWGSARIDSDPHQLPRFTPWDQGRLRFGIRLAANLTRQAATLTA